MKYIELDSWKRKEHYELFKGLDYPHFSICANVDISQIYPFIKKLKLSFFKTILFAITQSANSVKELRYRIQGEKIVEYSKVNPSFTILTEDDLFSFCTVEYVENFKEFIINTSKEINNIQKNPSLRNKLSCDNILYITSIPWISFTNITHTINMHPVDSIPRITWGKFFEDNRKLKLPLSIQVHHALVDAIHVANFFKSFQKLVNDPSLTIAR